MWLNQFGEIKRRNNENVSVFLCWERLCNRIVSMYREILWSRDSKRIFCINSSSSMLGHLLWSIKKMQKWKEYLLYQTFAGFLRSIPLNRQLHLTRCSAQIHFENNFVLFNLQIPVAQRLCNTVHKHCSCPSHRLFTLELSAHVGSLFASLTIHIFG